MTESELKQCLATLDLTLVEAAELLSISSRTMRRWAENTADIPGPAEQALRAWVRLHSSGLAWRPDTVAFGGSDEEVAETIATYRQHAMALDDVLRRVADRGGPIAPWVVDIERKRADLESMSISFYRLRNGGFSPSVFRRTDSAGVDIQRDWTLIEDGFACIAKAIANDA